MTEANSSPIPTPTFIAEVKFPWNPTTDSRTMLQEQRQVWTQLQSELSNLGVVQCAYGTPGNEYDLLFTVQSKSQTTPLHASQLVHMIRALVPGATIHVSNAEPIDQYFRSQQDAFAKQYSASGVSR